MHEADKEKDINYTATEYTRGFRLNQDLLLWWFSNVYIYENLLVYNEVVNKEVGQSVFGMLGTPYFPINDKAIQSEVTQHNHM